MRVFIACAIALHCAPCTPFSLAQFTGSTLPKVADEAPLAAADLAFDAAILRQALEAIHPGLYRYNTKEEMAAHFAEFEAEFARVQTRRQAFIALSRFTAKIKCGHTFPNPHNQSKAVQSELLSQPDKVPFAFKWLSGKMIVSHDLTQRGLLPKGTEVLEINGIPVANILDQLMTIARADGSNDDKRISLLEVTGLEKFETFDIYFPLFFPQRDRDFAMKIRSTPGSAESTITVEATTFESRLKLLHAAGTSPQDANQPLWHLSKLPDGSSYLKMPSWVAYKTAWDWKGFIHETFDTLSKSKAANLVIDLRGNEGGSGVGEVILSRLIEKPVPISPSQRFVRYLKIPADLEPMLDTWDPSFKDWSKEASGPLDLADRGTSLPPGTTDGYYQLRDENERNPGESDDTLSPQFPRFEGRVFVLVDAHNSSATFEFARQAKSLKVATLVGQPTGGNQRGINGGAFFFLRLPKSGLEVDIPIMGQFPKPGMPVSPDAGIVPDVIVTRTIEDIARGVDAELSAVARLIETKK